MPAKKKRNSYPRQGCGEATTPLGCVVETTPKKRARTQPLINHRISNALLQRSHLLERNVLPAVDLHYVIDRRLNHTDFAWKLRSTAIGTPLAFYSLDSRLNPKNQGLVVQCPYGLGDGKRRKLLKEVRERILSQDEDKKRRTSLAVLKRANMVKMRAQFGGMRYALVEALDGNSYMGTSSVLFYSPALALFGMREEAMVTFGSVRSRFVVLANLPGHDNVANKLAQLKARIVPLLHHFRIELKELKEIVGQCLRGRIFTNKETLSEGARVAARIELRVRQFTDLEKVRSDRDLVITLIHELAHAITPIDVKYTKGRGKLKVSHGPLFWENVMKIAQVASETEDPTDSQSNSGEEGRARRPIFCIKNEREFRNKIEREDSIWDDGEE